MTARSVRAECVSHVTSGAFAGCLPCFLNWITAANGPAPHSAVCSGSEWGDRRSRGGGAVEQWGGGGATCQASDLSMGPGCEETSGTRSPMQASLLCFCFALERRLSVSQKKEGWNPSPVPGAELARHLSLLASHYPDRLTARPGSLMPTQRKPANRMRNDQSGILRLCG